MKDTFFQCTYKCNKCHQEIKEYVWGSKMYDFKKKCSTEKCKGKYEPILYNSDESFNIGGKHKKGRSAKEKYKRSIGHFKKEIMPTLDADNRRHFERKHGK